MAKKYKGDKWETKKAFYFTAPSSERGNHSSSWGVLDRDQNYLLYQRHKVPEGYDIVSHTRFAGKEAYREEWEGKFKSKNSKKKNNGMRTSKKQKPSYNEIRHIIHSQNIKNSKTPNPTESSKKSRRGSINLITVVVVAALVIAIPILGFDVIANSTS